jgi:hypothetical protein
MGDAFERAELESLETSSCAALWIRAVGLSSKRDLAALMSASSDERWRIISRASMPTLHSVRAGAFWNANRCCVSRAQTSP